MTFDTYTLNYLIKQHGRNAQLKKRVASAYSAATGTVTSSSTSYKVKVYGYDITNQLGDNSIEGGVQMFAISATLINGVATPEPDTDDQLVVGSKTFDIVRVNQIYSGDKVLVYMAQVKD